MGSPSFLVFQTNFLLKFVLMTNCFDNPIWKCRQLVMIVESCCRKISFSSICALETTKKNLVPPFDYSLNFRTLFSHWFFFYSSILLLLFVREPGPTIRMNHLILEISNQNHNKNENWSQTMASLQFLIYFQKSIEGRNYKLFTRND